MQPLISVVSPVYKAENIVEELVMRITENVKSITEDFEIDEEVEEDSTIKIAIVGRPNAGKSSIVNALLGEKRVIVSDVSGTTRDSIDSRLTYNNREFVIIDTAGIRKKSNIYNPNVILITRLIILTLVV